MSDRPREEPQSIKNLRAAHKHREPPSSLVIRQACEAYDALARELAEAKRQWEGPDGAGARASAGNHL